MAPASPDPVYLHCWQRALLSLSLPNTPGHLDYTLFFYLKVLPRVLQSNLRIQFSSDYPLKLLPCKPHFYHPGTCAQLAGSIAKAKWLNYHHVLYVFIIKCGPFSNQYETGVGKNFCMTLKVSYSTFLDIALSMYLQKLHLTSSNVQYKHKILQYKLNSVF